LFGRFDTRFCLFSKILDHVKHLGYVTPIFVTRWGLLQDILEQKFISKQSRNGPIDKMSEIMPVSIWVPGALLDRDVRKRLRRDAQKCHTSTNVLKAGLFAISSSTRYAALG
jgi:hypothetical protein